LLCSLRWVACWGDTGQRGDSLDGNFAESVDGVALVQALTQRHRKEVQVVANGTAAMFDVDGCPVTDAKQAYVGACGRPDAKKHVQALEGRCGDSMQNELREGEKMVYFMRHASPTCCADCGLADTGRGQCRGLKANNKLLLHGPLSASQPVEIVYTSPATRAMETGIRIFGDTGAPFVIDTRLVENQPFSHCRSCEQELLEQTIDHPELLEQWHALFPNRFLKTWSDWHKNPPGRVDNFTKHLLQRPERHIAVVAHFMLLGSFHELGMGCMSMGKTVVQGALQSDGKWRRVSEDSCQGRRRRWGDWGNYRRRQKGDA